MKTSTFKAATEYCTAYLDIFNTITIAVEKARDKGANTRDKLVREAYKQAAKDILSDLETLVEG